MGKQNNESAERRAGRRQALHEDDQVEPVWSDRAMCQLSVGIGRFCYHCIKDHRSEVGNLMICGGKTKVMSAKMKVLSHLKRDDVGELNEYGGCNIERELGRY